MIKHIDSGRKEEMVKISIKEFVEGDNAVRTVSITLFNVPIYKYRKESTNNNAVSMLTVKSKMNKIKGFTNED